MKSSEVLEVGLHWIRLLSESFLLETFFTHVVLKISPLLHLSVFSKYIPSNITTEEAPHSIWTKAQLTCLVYAGQNVSTKPHSPSSRQSRSLAHRHVTSNHPHPSTLNRLIAPSTALDPLPKSISSSLPAIPSPLSVSTRLSGPVTVCPFACAKPAERSCAGFGL
jgi:hypothetical protein